MSGYKLSCNRKQTEKKRLAQSNLIPAVTIKLFEEVLTGLTNVQIPVKCSPLITHIFFLKNFKAHL